MDDQWIKEKYENEKDKYNDSWQLLAASSKMVMPSRWKTLWTYVLFGKTPVFTITAWVRHNQNQIGTLQIYQERQ